MILLIFPIVVYSLLSLIRALYWLAVVQQKEYRWDRIRLFVHSAEGVQAFWQVVPPRSQINRTQLKRPRLTPRIVLIGCLSAGFWIFLVYLGILAALSFGSLFGELLDHIWHMFFFYVIWLVGILLGIPGIVLLTTAPTRVMSLVVTRRRITQAQHKLRRARPLVIGVTGSYGKTAARHLLASVMGGEEHVFTPIGSYNTRYSVASDIVKNYQQQPTIILEYAAYTEHEIAGLAALFPPHQAIITGLTWQHLGLFGSLEHIIRAKAELIAALPAQSVVYWNGKDALCEQIVQLGQRQHEMVHRQESHLEIHSVTPENVGMSKLAVSEMGSLSFSFAHQNIETQLVGLHYAQNIALAIAVARNRGVSDADIVRRIRDFQPSGYFTRAWSTENGVVVIDDGRTSNPKGFAAVLATAQLVSATPKILICGGIVDLGDDSRRIHLELAEQTKQIFDTVCYVGAVGRSEFAQLLGQACLSEPAQILAHLDQLPSNALVVIEGKLPGWLRHHFLLTYPK